MEKSPRRSQRLNTVSSKYATTTMPTEKDVPPPNTVATTAAMKPASPATTRPSSTASTVSQDSTVHAMQKRIAALENSLKAAQAKLRENELQNAANNAISAPSTVSQVTTLQLPVFHPPEMQITTTAATNTLPLPSIANNRYSPVASLQEMQETTTAATNRLHLPSLADNGYSPPLFTTYTSTANARYNPLGNMYANPPLPAANATSLRFNTVYTPADTHMSSAIAPSSYPPRKMQALPDFCGKAEDWPIFFTAYTESTAVYGYSNFENNQRLQRSLKGEARESVKSLLIHPNNVTNIIEQLKFRFGRPEQLIRSQLARVKEIAPISENAMIKLVPFASSVNNICAFLQSARGGEQHLTNPTLLDELVMKLPMSKRIDWASHAAAINPYATVTHFSEWLTSLANVICTVQDSDSVRDHKRRVVLHAAQNHRQQDCPICNGQHKISECKQFLELTASNRWTQVKQCRLCFSCLASGHGTRDCQRRKPCGTEGCKRIHHKLLHEAERPTNYLQRAIHSGNRHDSSIVQSKDRSIAHANQPICTQQPQKKNAEASVLNCSNNSASKLLFRILPVILYGKNKSVETYALLDEGSSVTMVDSTLVDELGLRGQQQRLNLQWVGGHASQEPAIVVELSISGVNVQKKHKLRNVYGVKNLQLPCQSLSQSELSCHGAYLCNLPVQTYPQVRPKLLIGLDHCYLGLPSTTVRVGESGPYAANTELGWVLFGPTYGTSILMSPTSTSSCLLLDNRVDQSLHDMVANFFTTESFGVAAAPPIESESDSRSRQILQSTTLRIDGRFQTGLIWKSDGISLPDSYPLALKRLIGVERRMSRDVEFCAEYKRILNSHIEKEYARKLTPAEAASVSPKTWYLPHFAVRNPNKPGKLRLVFDAAAQVEGVSLNSQLLKGPQEYKSLPSILFHFRNGAVAVCGDIREMFHQVVIQPGDRCAQRFLWRDGDATKQPEVYEMRVMTFGAACSPCSANYVKKVNALEYENNNEITARAVHSILNHHYVDDYVDSFATEEEAIAVSEKVREIHLKAGFELRDFSSNSHKVVSILGGSEYTRPISQKDGISVERVLGLFWQPSTDCFGFQLKFNNVDPAVINGSRCPTKRELLSVVMSIFDPLGFLAHFVIGAKLIMREVWKTNTQWDESLRQEVNEAWAKWRNQMVAVNEFAMPRYYFQKGIPQMLQLHIFVDASEDAFAAVAYYRSVSSSGEVEVSFICAKSKCAPIKPLTVPRLELQAAVLGTRLLNCVREDHPIDSESCYLWSDSTTVLRWIGSEHRRYKPFVQHRVAEILASTKTSNWKWIPTSQNVADVATRANNHVEFSQTTPWLSGPSFLKESQHSWPTSDIALCDNEDTEEELRRKYALVIVDSNIFNFKRFSTFSKLVRTAAWFLRFIAMCRRQTHVNEVHGPSARETELAKFLLCRLVQREAFPIEIQQIESGHDIARNSELLHLSPYIDKEGVLRVQGRIDSASWLPISSRRPIILPPNHAFTNLLIMHYHCIMCHQNTEATICEIRRTYWIPRLRSMLRGVIAKCHICRLRKAQPKTPLMGPLPVDRLTPYIRPFSYTGLDYFGPMTVTVRRSTEKRWVALFTCLTVRAVHLELAHDLSTDSCIVAIRNFINRRGVPIRLRTDNGKNFVGADKEAKRFGEVFDCSRVQDELSQRGVEWVFNSPFNPAEGGAWERLVQCVKRVLRCTLKETAPREHTLNCLLIEAENIINSRPLTHLPIHVNQEQPLTPNDFLLGEANNAQTSAVSDTVEKVSGLRQQWRIARQLRDHFWKRWIAEYLPTLTRRVKWCQRSEKLHVGDLVFVCDPNVPRRDWCRGKIERVYPGTDGEVRRADVKTSSGVKRRAVSTLAVLDVDVGESS